MAFQFIKLEAIPISLSDNILCIFPGSEVCWYVNKLVQKSYNFSVQK